MSTLKALADAWPTWVHQPSDSLRLIRYWPVIVKG